MFAKINSVGVFGMDGYAVEVECSVTAGLPAFATVGLPDTAVKESQQRVTSAITSVGFDFPLGKVVVNLAPGNIKKEGSGFDLPIALAILFGSDTIKCRESLEDYAFIGELSLSGELRPVSGVLPMAVAAWKSGFKKIIVPKENALEASVVKHIEVYGAEDIRAVLAHICGQRLIEQAVGDASLFNSHNVTYAYDFADVKGQSQAKRALEIAAAGGHNCLLIGTPGSGKTMLAQRLPSILPDMSFEEALEVTKIHSIAGTLPEKIPFMRTRPFRAPHHTVSTVSLTGGGRIPKPGEVSLAHGGVLFLDELPEFSKNALEVLRQPVEDKKITVSRINATVTYPSNFMLITALNPCPCGYFGDKTHTCTCNPGQIQRYLGKLSGPLLDRIDLQLQVHPVEYSSLTTTEKAESSAEIKRRVNSAREIQRQRYKNMGIYSNADLSSKDIEVFCMLSPESKQILESAFTRLGLSARAYTRIIKVARTIADLDKKENILPVHIAEAIGYRALDRNFFTAGK